MNRLLVCALTAFSMTAGACSLEEDRDAYWSQEVTFAVVLDADGELFCPSALVVDGLPNQLPDELRETCTTETVRTEVVKSLAKLTADDYDFEVWAAGYRCLRGETAPCEQWHVEGSWTERITHDELQATGWNVQALLTLSGPRPVQDLAVTFVVDAGGARFCVNRAEVQEGSIGLPGELPGYECADEVARIAVEGPALRGESAYELQAGVSGYRCPPDESGECIGDGAFVKGTWAGTVTEDDLWANGWQIEVPVTLMGALSLEEGAHYFGDVCRGDAAPLAANYDGARPPHLVAEVASDFVDEEWRPTSVAETQLVLCVETTSEEGGENCEYVNYFGPVLRRGKTDADVELRVARTGELVAAERFTTEIPPCPPIIRVTGVGGLPDNWPADFFAVPDAAIARWLAPFVTGSSP